MSNHPTNQSKVKGLRILLITLPLLAFLDSMSFGSCKTLEKTFELHGLGDLTRETIIEGSDS